MCLILGSLGSRLFFFYFFWLEMSISTQIINIGFKLYKPIALDRVERWTILPPQKRDQAWTKLSKVRHMSKLKFFYLGLLNSVSKPTFSNVYGLHISPMYTWTFLCVCCLPGSGISRATHPAWGTLHQHTTPNNERGEPTASYRWTGWVWETTSWSSSRLQENHRLFWKNLWNIPQFNEENPQDVKM